MRVIIIIASIIFFYSCKSKSDIDAHQGTESAYLMNANDTISKHEVTAQLVENMCCPNPCGILTSAMAQKFKVIQAGSELQTDYIIVIERCPEMKGKDFFQTGKLYKMTVILKGKSNKGFMIDNKYDKESLLTYWSENTEMLN